MNIVALSTLRQFWGVHLQAEKPLRLLHGQLTSRAWSGPQELKDAFGHRVDFVRGDGGDIRAIFDVSGNKFRVVISISFERNRGFVKFVGTHAQYDRIDAATVKRWTSDRSEPNKITVGPSKK